MASINRMTPSFGQLLLPSISLLIIFLLSTSFAAGQRDVALQNLVKDIKESKILTWNLVDESNEGTESETNAPLYQLRMWADGTYEEIEDGQQLEGLWTVNKVDAKIVFLCKSANGYDLQGVNPPIHFEVAKYSSDELILIWKGPKTSITKTYRRLATPFRG